MKKFFKKFTAALTGTAMILGAFPALALGAESEIDRILSSAGGLVMSFEGSLPAGVSTSGTVEYVEGVSGLAAKFGGNGSYLKLPDNINAGVTDFTLGMWVRFDAVTPDVWQRVIDIHGAGNRSMYFGMWQYNGGNNVRFGIEDDDGEEQASAFGAFKLGEWVNYTITQKGDARTLYINGREVSSSGASNTADAVGATENNYMGHTIANKVPAEDFNGAIDEFFFVKEAMTAEQVLELAVRNMDDAKALEAYKSLTYLNFNGNGAERMFDYYTFDDGKRSVRWSSSRPELLTVSGVTAGAAVSELTEVTLTAAVTSGAVSDKIDFTYVITPELEVWNMSMEDVKKRELRRGSSVNYDVSKAYLLKKVGSEEYLTQNDGVLTLTADPADANAKWRFADSVHKNAYGIFNIADGLCLDVLDYGTKAGTEVILYRGGKGINENWYFIDMGDGISILNYNGNHFLNASADRASIESLDDAQRWEIIETDRGKIRVGEIIDEQLEAYETMDESVYYTFKRSGGYMSTDMNGSLCVSGFNGDNSLWFLTRITDNYYTITNKAADKNLNINRNSIEAGAGVITYDRGTAQNEQWGFVKAENGYTIEGAANKNYLCGFGGSFRMEADPQIWTLEVYQSTSSSSNGSEKRISPLITDYLPAVTSATDYATGIIHPGISIDKDDIERIQRHVRNGDEPWASAFNQFAGQADTRANPRIYAWDGGGDTTKLVVEARLKNLRGDATTAANQALMYVITGDEAYRTNAMNIIRRWSELRDVYAELGSDRIDHGVIAYKLSFAAELMKYTSCENPDLVWTADDNTMFVGMLETINPKHNRFWHWMNQHGICNTGTMASAIFRNDLEQYKTAVVRTTVNPEGGGESALAGGAIIQIFKLLTKDALLDEELDEPVVSHLEMGRDMGHAYDNNEALSTCAMMTLKQNTLVDPETGEYTADAERGVNVFEFAGHRLLEGCSIVSKYNLGLDVEFPTVDVGGYYYGDINDTNRGNLNALGTVYCYYKYIAKADMDDDKIKYVTKAYESRFPEASQADSLGMATLLYTGDEGIIDKMPAQDTSSATTWQSEWFTALNYGRAEPVSENNSSFLRVSLENGGTRFAHTTVYYAPGEQDKVILRVRTHGEVKITIQNEHLMYAPFVEGIIPDTMGEWESVEFARQPEASINQRMMFFTLEGDGGEIDIDYMKFTN